MKHLSKDELTKELEKLGHSFQLSSVRKEKMKRQIFNVQPYKNKKIRETHKWIPIIISLVVLVSIAFSVFTLVDNDINVSSGNSSNVDRLTDHLTPEQLPSVTQSDNTFLIDWGTDSMDRGNHDYFTSVHGKLVVNPDYSDLNRGDVIYYKTPEAYFKRDVGEHYIGRVVGLPGETVEIKEGQVFVNDKILETFYGKATKLGKDEEAYWRTVDISRLANIEVTKEYFATNMDPVKVTEDTVFVLVDQWWRGSDSREYGLLSLDSIEGKVLGYVKNE